MARKEKLFRLTLEVEEDSKSEKKRKELKKRRDKNNV